MDMAEVSTSVASCLDGHRLSKLCGICRHSITTHDGSTPTSGGTRVLGQSLLTRELVACAEQCTPAAVGPTLGIRKAYPAPAHSWMFTDVSMFFFFFWSHTFTGAQTHCSPLSCVNISAEQATTRLSTQACPFLVWFFQNQPKLHSTVGERDRGGGTGIARHIGVETEKFQIDIEDDSVGTDRPLRVLVGVHEAHPRCYSDSSDRSRAASWRRFMDHERQQ